MSEIKGFVVTLVSMLILITAIELISPDNSMKKYLKFVLGTILVAVMISPIISIISKGEDNLSQKIEEYVDLVENKSLETINTNNEDKSKLQFKNNLEENCNRLLKENFNEFDFKSSIDCDINMAQITYSINEVKVFVKDKSISKIEKIIINNGKESTEVSSNNESINNEEEIISYLTQTLNISKDKIKIYKMN